MRNNILSLLGFSILLFSAGCKKDNYDPPKSMLTGKVVYQGQPVGVRSNAVQLELWQYGYKLFGKIPVYIAQDGTFSAALFDGDYKLVRLAGGPWANGTDSIDVRVSGATTVEVPVDPYFVINNPAFQKSGNAVTGTFSLQSVNTTKGLELVRIYLGQTTIVDQNNKAVVVEKVASAITDITQPITLSADVPAALIAKGYVYARVGVKAVGVAELMYSPVQKISLK
jgi:hypothetical protein